MKKLVALFAVILIYVGFVGPLLISAPSTIAVLLGITIAAVLAYMTYRVIAAIINPNQEKKS